MHMRPWQAVVVVLLAAAGVLLIVAYPPHALVIVARPSVTSTAAPTVQPASDQPTSLVFVGDIMLSRSVGELMEQKGDWTWPFAKITSATAGADLAFGNLETTISSRGMATGCTYCFRADPRAMAGLTAAGFDVLSVANNHIWDYGLDAFTDTLRYLADDDISAVGGGRDSSEARGPIIRTVGNNRVAYLAFTDLLPRSAGADTAKPGANLYEPKRMAEDIARARLMAHVVIVSFHTGTEYKPADDRQRLIYEAAIDAGADLVVGHHPHVVQDLRQYHGGWIAYSLGNFIFDQSFSAETMTGMMLTARVDDGHLVDVASRSVTISRQFQPSLAPSVP